MTDALAAVLDGTAIDPAAPALTDAQGRSLTHEQLDQRVRAIATGLLAHGLQPGEKMLLSLRTSTAGMCLALGCVAAGGTVMFADPATQPEKFDSALPPAAAHWTAAESLQYAVGRPGPGQALARRRGLTLPDLAGLPVRHIHSGPWLPGVPRSALSLRRLLATTPAARAELPTMPGDRPAVIVFTPGPSGALRATVHTRASCGAALDLSALAMPLSAGDVVVTDQFLMGLPALAAGAHWRLPPSGFSPGADPKVTSALIDDSTVLIAAPADLAMIAAGVASGEINRPARLRSAVSVGAAVTAPLIRAIENLVPAKDLLTLYGTTEIMPAAAATGQEILDYPGPGDLIGAPLTGVFAHTDSDGELRLSGPHLAASSLDGRRTADHPTGDLVRFDAGRLVVHGRKSLAG